MVLSFRDPVFIRNEVVFVAFGYPSQSQICFSDTLSCSQNLLGTLKKFQFDGAGAVTVLLFLGFRDLN
jgi:hypothetical protein